MVAAALLSAITIAFPGEGRIFPPITRCYVIGATDGAETALTVCGREVPVHRTGAWSTMLDVRPGTNVIEVAGARRTFVVQPPSPSAAKPPPPKVYTKLPYAADSARPHPTGRKPSEVTVVIDAGHGGREIGAVSPHGLEEKDANLRLAKAITRKLQIRGFRVVMTRTDDATVELYDRPKVAHRENADAFVSIHHNAPSHNTDPFAVRYHAVYAWNPLGERLAKAINRRMAESTDLRNAGVLHANFAVIRNPEIPSCLIETDFITSPDGESAAWDPDRRAMTADAIAAGIADWLDPRARN